MDYSKLRKHIIALAHLPTSTDAPTISAYFDLEVPRELLIQDLENWSILTRETFQDDQRVAFDDAVDEVAHWLMTTTGRSGAVFSRWGEHPFFLPMTFDVAIPSSLQVADCPKIYPLVELKDRFNRFVLVLVTESKGRILEINLGKTSTEILTERPALRERIGREWTREHYNNQRRERDKMFIREKIQIIEELTAKRGHNTLIIAGKDHLVSQLRNALPKHLERKVIDELKVGIPNKKLHAVISQAIDRFLEIEEQESNDTVGRLIEAVRANQLGTVGLENTRKALVTGQASHLIISSKTIESDREELVRLASRHGAQIETVQNSNLLEKNGGVGALLRYATNDTLQAQAKVS